MDEQPTAGGILAREWRLLKPLSWLLVASLAVLGLAIWLYPSLTRVPHQAGPDKAPLQVVIHERERLEPAEIEFDQPTDIKADNEDTVGGLKPMMIYRVGIKQAGKAFSHPFTLNFMGDATPPDLYKRGELAAARLEGNSWIRLPGRPQGHERPGAGSWWSIAVEGPGVYALCVVNK